MIASNNSLFSLHLVMSNDRCSCLPHSLSILNSYEMVVESVLTWTWNLPIGTFEIGLGPSAPHTASNSCIQISANPRCFRANLWVCTGLWAANHHHWPVPGSCIFLSDCSYCLSALDSCQSLFGPKCSYLLSVSSHIITSSLVLEPSLWALLW